MVREGYLVGQIYILAKPYEIEQTQEIFKDMYDPEEKLKKKKRNF